MILKSLQVGGGVKEKAVMLMQGSVMAQSEQKDRWELLGNSQIGRVCLDLDDCGV